MTPKEQSAMQQALEALIKANHFHDYEDEITALREALAEQAEQEPVAWMWACAECGTEAKDGTDCRICGSCGYHKFYKAPKVATCVCAAKTQEKVKQEPVAVVGFDTQSWRNLVDALTKLPDGTKLYAEPANKTEEKPLLVQAWEKRFAEQAEQEQVAVLDITYGHEPECYATPNADDLPEGTYRLYATPLAQQDTHATHVVRTKDPCHPWQDLTDDEIDEIESEILMGGGEYIDVIRAVIAADREKNK